ncbi:MAG: recombinase family protein [Candidatus Omnitrophica bacterium]|nr:recombinase family protein [Candidatus Omnitrophota bacterium]
MKNCAIYCRYSSEQQRDSMSIEAQKRACSEFAEKQGLAITKYYVDEARSGTTDDREAFQEMISDALSDEKPFKSIIVHKLDRFARNRYDSIKYKQILRKEGIRVLSATQPILGSGDPVEVILESVLEGMDEFYSLNLARESLKGMAENARHGWINGGFAPFGYKLIKIQTEKGTKNKLEIEESEAKIVRQIYDMYLAGEGVQAIRYKLNLEGTTFRRGRKFSKNNVTDILRNEKYVGDVTFGKRLNRAKRTFDFKFEPVTVKNVHQPIIQRKDWEAVQQTLNEHAAMHPRVSASDYLFSGIMKCDLCGSHFIGAAAHGRKERYRYYVCGKISREGSKGCPQIKLNADRFEKIVIHKLKGKLTAKECLLKMVSEYNDTLKQAIRENERIIPNIKREIEEIDNKRRRLFEAIENGIGLSKEDISPRIKELTALKADKETDLKTLTDQLICKPIKESGRIVDEWIRFYNDLFNDEAFWKNKILIQTMIVEIRIDAKYAYVSYNPDVSKLVDKIRIDEPPDDGGGSSGGGRPPAAPRRFGYSMDRGAIQMSATVAIVWLSFPIEVKVVMKGAKKVSFSLSKAFSIEVEPPVRRKIQGEELKTVMV